MRHLDRGSFRVEHAALPCHDGSSGAVLALTQGTLMATVTTQLRAKDIMTPEPVCVGPATTIRELARVFEMNEISGAPVVDSNGTLIGVVSKTDLIRSCTEGTADVPPSFLFEVLSERMNGSSREVMPEPLTCVQDFMTDAPFTVAPEALVSDVARQMVARHIHRVVVVDVKNFPAGIITSLDVVDALSR
jgi:CBS domain-containing protein